MRRRKQIRGGAHEGRRRNWGSANIDRRCCLATAAPLGPHLNSRSKKQRNSINQPVKPHLHGAVGEVNIRPLRPHVRVQRSRKADQELRTTRRKVPRRRKVHDLGDINRTDATHTSTTANAECTTTTATTHPLILHSPGRRRSVGSISGRRRRRHRYVPSSGAIHAAVPLVVLLLILLLLLLRSSRGGRRPGGVKLEAPGRRTAAAEETDR